MRLVGGGAETSPAVCLIVGVVSFEPDGAALSFESQNMCGDAVEKPAVVADDDGASCKMFNRFFKGAERVYIEIVGRLIEEQNVRALLQHLREVHSIPFAA